ncbi:ABC transporter substrate-binding protein [Corticimicrobacter populi]|uniref:Branched-chain amino acid ABC transporter substrate-binding protein n=1 Tax=Corticimicrobacter populi TaxID=2175229 RepID=A0A2V1JU76_9BURK|nr:ABC transporter substrate-binding protein [Corticimicrobacter populi]PWF21539.1 branched-chain amino acid ABC transporter substrate-binding protein [Corticimicrobacter populi]QDQ88865.1 ABC transporter substrate-binding protein [Alcaligenaceae bacterium SJ-26]
MKRYLTAASILVACAWAPAQATDLYLGASGGTTEKVMKEKVIPLFQQKHGDVNVIYVAGNSTDTLAKMQAQRNRPEFDVVVIDDGPMMQAQQFGLCAKLEDAPVYQDRYPLAQMGDSASALGVIATGLFYNTEAFAKAGWPAPDSWEDLTDPKFKQKVVVPPISNGYGLHTLIKFAELRGGNLEQIEPGFEAMINEVGPNVLAWEPSPGKMTELFQNGDGVLGVWGSGRVQALKDTGFPVEFVYPKEGAIALFTAVCPIAKPNPKPEAQAFVQHLLSPEVQAILAEGVAWGPVNSKTELSPEVAATVPYGPEQIAKLQSLDYSVINAKRGEWTNRWNRTVER